MAKMWGFWGLLLAGFLAPFGCGSAPVQYVLEVRHQHYPDFREVNRARQGERFVIGDTNVEAKIVRFEPDFAIDREAKTIFSRSESMNNPAVLVEVYEDGDKKAEVWAFRNSPPHARTGTPLLFFLLSVEDLEGNRLDVAPDSLSPAPDGGTVSS
jgi:hypothetical protein